jgi:hypothetical protein
VEYLTVTVTADVTLDTQPVDISFDRQVWVTAAWQGSSGTTRDARALIDGTNVPAPGVWPVYVRITDSPETPVVYAGSVTVS